MDTHACSHSCSRRSHPSEQTHGGYGSSPGASTCQADAQCDNQCRCWMSWSGNTRHSRGTLYAYDQSDLLLDVWLCVTLWHCTAHSPVWYACRCVQRQQFCVYSGDCLVLATGMNMLDIPFKECFTVNTLWRVEPAAEGGCSVTVHLRVRHALAFAQYAFAV